MCSLSSEEGGCEKDGVTGAEDPKGEAPSYCAAGAAAGGGRCKLGTAAVTAGMPSYRSWRESTRVWWSKRRRQFLSNDATLSAGFGDWR